MTACDHDTCPHGHWATHRHCQVAGCDYVEKRGASFGHFVEGHFVCPAHGVMAADRKARYGSVTLQELGGNA